VVASGCEHLLASARVIGVVVAEGLSCHGRPEEATELAGDSDGGEGGELAVAGQVAGAFVEADLRLPGAGERLRRHEPVVLDP
jgi:hypothetical protein